MDTSAYNFNPSANTDGDNCIATLNGCMDPSAYNYNPTANTSDGSCEYLTFDGNWPSRNSFRWRF